MKIIVTKHQMAGYLAAWAIRQSPYPVPDNLAVAVVKFGDALPLKGDAPPMEEFYAIEDERQLYDAVRTAIHAVPEICAWNERKNGNKASFGIANDAGRDPDNDFIDLDALARNVTHSAIREEMGT